MIGIDEPQQFQHGGRRTLPPGKGGGAVRCSAVFAHLRTGPSGVHLELALPQDGSVRDGLEVHLNCNISATQRQP